MRCEKISHSSSWYTLGMKRIIIVHGWSGSPADNWLPWLRSELENSGHKVLVPNMPDADNPSIEGWVNHLTEIIGIPDSNTYFVGHSIGCQAILRYLETVATPIGGAVFVAGWFNLENLESEEEKEIAKPWIETPIDIQKVKAILPKSTLIISDNDDYGAFEENRQKFKQFISKEIVLHNAEHITDVKYPEILHEIQSLIQ